VKNFNIIDSIGNVK